MSSELFGFDAYSPKEIAERVETVGVTKARLPPMRTFTLGMLAGGFVGLGGMAATMIKSDASLSPAVAQLLSYEVPLAITLPSCSTMRAAAVASSIEGSIAVRTALVYRTSSIDVADAASTNRFTPGSTAVAPSGGAGGAEIADKIAPQ